MSSDDVWSRCGGRLCLDFVNTLRDRARVPRETLAVPQDLRRWLEWTGTTAPARPAARDADALDLARKLRDALDRAVLAAADGALPAPADLALLNSTAAAHPPPAPQLTVLNGKLMPTTTPAPASADLAAGLALVAQDAVALLPSPEVRRVRVCGADGCALRFVDRSPAHNRRWCSMERCGNRAKARRHLARTGRSPRADGGG
ncbi:CGNR zinc finger domain-containing protein [Streptomyces albofaciens]|uniref:CGNR zinc finger domain-containing protein n=1 Tax=Streptomyces albofaciens TaxID=66866 RepID=UPI001FCB15D2|nr:ABATE domain-containing protein [Streptomyces albofaciens]